MTGELHLGEGELDAFADGELAAADRARVAAHIGSCESCRAELEELRRLRGELRSNAARVQGHDSAFEARVRAALDREDARGATLLAPRHARVWLRAGLAAAAVAAALGVWLAIPARIELPSEIAKGTLAAANAASEAVDAAALEARFAAAPLPFAPRVLDLRMLGWEVAGGWLEPMAERASLQIVYRDTRGRSLLCVMLAADASELPPDGARFSEGGIAFYAFTRGEVTVVAWAEGDVFCFLAGALPLSELRALAVAKAMLPASARAPS